VALAPSVMTVLLIPADEAPIGSAIETESALDGHRSYQV
jgi:hypothetical protein